MTAPSHHEATWVYKHINTVSNIVHRRKRMDDNNCMEIIESLRDYNNHNFLKRRKYSFEITSIEERDSVLDASLEASCVYYERTNESVMDIWHKLHSFIMYLYPDSLYINI